MNESVVHGSGEWPEGEEESSLIQSRNRARLEPVMHIVGTSPQMTAIRERIIQIAPFNGSVLITGETGTGKELIAKAIHSLSRRSQKPFIPVNSAGLTESLLSSQLFGHRKGAFTGAIDHQEGMFEAAEGGTLFLDEIADLSQTMQPHLLRALQEKEVTRVGETKPRKIDVRIISATSKHLEKLVEQETFGSDLLHRLDVCRIHVPPLRERKEDIHELITHLLPILSVKLGIEMGKRSIQLAGEVYECLLQYDWNGNVRELENFVAETLITSQSPTICFKDLPERWQQRFSRVQTTPLQERARLLSVLRKNKGNKTKTAKELGCSRETLYRMMDKYDIKRRRVAQNSWPREFIWMI